MKSEIKEEIEKKEKKQLAFIEKLNKVKGRLTQAQVAEKIGVSNSTVKSWYRASGYNYPSDENIAKICKAFTLKEDYFEDKNPEPDFNLSYSQITELTGLSSMSLAVLHSIQRSAIRENEDRVLNAPESYGRSYTTIDLINYVLEKCYRECSDRTIFDNIYAAIFLSEYIASKDEIIGFMNTDSFEQTIASKRDLFQTYNLNQVTKWIMNQYQEEERKLKGKEIKDKQPVENEGKY